MALRCLTLPFAPMKSKKLDDNLPYIMKVVPVSLSIHVYAYCHSLCFSSLSLQWGTPPREASEKENNQPHIVLFKDEDEQNALDQYFLSVEQQLMMETSNIVSAVFLCIAAHYIFNLSYHRRTGDVWLFVQEKVLHLSSKAGVKHNPSSTSNFSGIKRKYDSLNSTETLEDEN